MKIGGYSDNKGSDAVNMALSAERANAAMAELINMGFAAFFEHRGFSVGVS